MKSSTKTLNWLRSQGVQLTDEAEIKRTYAGRWQRAAGAWTWQVFDPKSLIQLGGYESLPVLLRCPTLAVEQIYIGGFSTGDKAVMCNCKGRCKGKAGAS